MEPEVRYCMTSEVSPILSSGFANSWLGQVGKVITATPNLFLPIARSETTARTE